MIAVTDLIIYLNFPKESVVKWLNGFSSSSHSFWHNICVRDHGAGKLLCSAQRFNLGLFYPALIVLSVAATTVENILRSWYKKITEIHLERTANVISYNKTNHVRIHRGDFLNLRFPLNLFLSQIDWITIGCVSVSHL